MGRSRVCASMLSAVLLLAPAISGAQPKPTDTQKQQAGDLVKKAIAKSQAGDHALSIELYLQAYQLIPNPILLSNIGSEYQQAQKPVEALKYFCKYLDAEPTGTSATYATAQAKTLQIQLNGSVDDKNVCKPVVKEKAPMPPVVETKPEPAPPPPVPHDTPEVTGTQNLTDKRTTSEPSGGGLRKVGYGVTVVGVGVLAAGIYYGMQAKEHSDFITNYTTDPATKGMAWPSNIRAYEDEGKSDQTKQIIFTAGGAAVALAGAGMIVFGGPTESSEQVSIRPVATPSSFGLAASGRF